jgi:hypothetical protein
MKQEIIYNRLIPMLQACLLCLLLLFSVLPHTLEKLVQHAKKDQVEKVNVDGTYLSARSTISSEVETQMCFLLEEIILQDNRVELFTTDYVFSPSIVPLALFKFTILANAP